MNLGVDDNRGFAFGAFIGVFHILSIPYSAQKVKFGAKIEVGKQPYESDDSLSVTNSYIVPHLR